MEKKKGYIYGYGKYLCRKIVDDQGSYRYRLGHIFRYGPTHASDTFDYELGGVRELGKAKGFRRTILSGRPY